MSDQSPEVIESQMIDTRESLTQKINALESHVVDTLHNATSTVSDLLDSAKTVVPNTIAEVKTAVSEQVNTTFNVTQHTKDKPWAMVGGSAALGFVVGMLAFRRGGSTNSGTHYAPAHPLSAAATTPVAARAPSAPIRLPGWLDQIVERLASKVTEEVRKLSEVAVSTVSTSIQHTLEHTVPKLLDSTVKAATREREPVQSPTGDNGFHSRM